MIESYSSPDSYSIESSGPGPNGRFIEVVPLDFETEHFGLKCGLIDLAPVADGPAVEARELVKAFSKSAREYDFITVSVPNQAAGIIPGLITLGLTYIDVDLTYGFDGAFTRRADHRTDIKTEISPHFEVAEADLLRLAEQFTTNHLRRDDRLDQTKARRLIADSIANHCRGRATYVISAGRGRDLAGLITVRILPKRVGKLVWVGVWPEFARQGMGRAMVGEVIDRFGDRHHLEVVTQQTNQAARSLYTKLGFSIKSMRHILHWWPKLMS